MFGHALDILSAEELRQKPPLLGRFRMDLDAPPFDNQVEFLLQLFDDALADEAERSYIVGKDLQFDCHCTHRASHVQRIS